MRLLACCACLLAMPAYAVVLDFENLGDGITRAVALRSASAEYAALGVSFSGGGGAPGQPPPGPSLPLRRRRAGER